MRGTAIFLAVILILSSASAAVHVHLRLSSGLRRMRLNEVNLALGSWAEGLKGQADLDPKQSFEGGAVSPLHLGLSFEAELLVTFSRWLGLGVSGGYIFGELTEEDTQLKIIQSGVLNSLARPTKVSANLYGVSGYFFVPFSQKFNLYLRAGLGTLRAKYVSREATKKPTDKKYVYPTLDTAKADSMTYLGGIGFSYAFDPALSFFVEGSAQPAKVSGFSGENKAGQKGTLFSYEEYRSNVKYWETKMRVLAQAPAGSRIRNVRGSTVDFSGFSAKIGILFRF
jgi:opacity protein-like surface antigen